MKIIHSAWTAPMSKKQVEQNLWLYGYSIDYANRIGVDLELYTDSYGATIFDCLPYREIHTTLDELNANKVETTFWSAGKIQALKDSELGTLHIDGDVFLKKESILPLLEMTGATSGENFDFICQMKERFSIFIEWYHEQIPMFNDAFSGQTFDGWQTGITESLNAGILGFNNPELKEKFVSGFFQMVSACTASQDFMSLIKYDLSQRKAPNLIVEQFYLAALADTYKYKGKYLLEMKSDNYNDDINDMNRQANEIGFAHAWGNSKTMIIEPIKDILAERNPKLFRAISDKVADINNI